MSFSSSSLLDIDGATPESARKSSSKSVDEKEKLNHQVRRVHQMLERELAISSSAIKEKVQSLVELERTTREESFAGLRSEIVALKARCQRYEEDSITSRSLKDKAATELALERLGCEESFVELRKAIGTLEVQNTSQEESLEELRRRPHVDPERWSAELGVMKQAMEGLAERQDVQGGSVERHEQQLLRYEDEFREIQKIIQGFCLESKSSMDLDAVVACDQRRQQHENALEEVRGNIGELAAKLSQQGQHLTDCENELKELRSSSVVSPALADGPAEQKFLWFEEQLQIHEKLLEQFENHLPSLKDLLSQMPPLKETCLSVGELQEQWMAFLDDALKKEETGEAIICELRESIASEGKLWRAAVIRERVDQARLDSSAELQQSCVERGMAEQQIHASIDGLKKKTDDLSASLASEGKLWRAAVGSQHHEALQHGADAASLKSLAEALSVEQQVRQNAVEELKSVVNEQWVAATCSAEQGTVTCEKLKELSLALEAEKKEREKTYHEIRIFLARSLSDPASLNVKEPDIDKRFNELQEKLEDKLRMLPDMRLNRSCAGSVSDHSDVDATGGSGNRTSLCTCESKYSEVLVRLQHIEAHLFRIKHDEPQSLDGAANSKMLSELISEEELGKAMSMMNELSAAGISDNLRASLEALCVKVQQTLITTNDGLTASSTSASEASPLSSDAKALMKELARQSLPSSRPQPRFKAVGCRSPARSCNFPAASQLDCDRPLDNEAITRQESVTIVPGLPLFGMLGQGTVGFPNRANMSRATNIIGESSGSFVAARTSNVGLAKQGQEGPQASAASAQMPFNRTRSEEGVVPMLSSKGRSNFRKLSPRRNQSAEMHHDLSGGACPLPSSTSSAVAFHSSPSDTGGLGWAAAPAKVCRQASPLHTAWTGVAAPLPSGVPAPLANAAAAVAAAGPSRCSS